MPAVIIGSRGESEWELARRLLAQLPKAALVATERAAVAYGQLPAPRISFVRAAGTAADIVVDVGAGCGSAGGLAETGNDGAVSAAGAAVCYAAPEGAPLSASGVATDSWLATVAEERILDWQSNFPCPRITNSRKAFGLVVIGPHRTRHLRRCLRPTLGAKRLALNPRLRSSGRMSVSTPVGSKGWRSPPLNDCTLPTRGAAARSRSPTGRTVRAVDSCVCR